MQNPLSDFLVKWRAFRLAPPIGGHLVSYRVVTILHRRYRHTVANGRLASVNSRPSKTRTSSVSSWVITGSRRTTTTTTACCCCHCGECWLHSAHRDSLRPQQVSRRRSQRRRRCVIYVRASCFGAVVSHRGVCCLPVMRRSGPFVRSSVRRSTVANNSVIEAAAEIEQPTGDNSLVDVRLRFFSNSIL